MGAAAELFADDGAENQRVELRRRRDMFVEKLSRLPWPIVVNGPPGNFRYPGNANIRFVGFDAHDILSVLQPFLAASTESACTSGIPEPSHALKAIDLNGDEAESSIRFSLGFGTSDQDVDEAAGLTEEALVKLFESQATR